MQQVSCSIAGKHGRYIHMQADVAPSAEDCVIAQEEAMAKAKQQYLRDKENCLKRQLCDCTSMNCPDAVHATGRFNKRQIITRGPTGKLCLGCGCS